MSVNAISHGVYFGVRTKAATTKSGRGRVDDAATFQKVVKATRGLSERQRGVLLMSGPPNGRKKPDPSRFTPACQQFGFTPDGAAKFYDNALASLCKRLKKRGTSLAKAMQAQQ